MKVNCMISWLTYVHRSASHVIINAQLMYTKFKIGISASVCLQLDIVACKYIYSQSGAKMAVVPDCVSYIVCWCHTLQALQLEIGANWKMSSNVG